MVVVSPSLAFLENHFSEVGSAGDTVYTINITIVIDRQGAITTECKRSGSMWGLPQGVNYSRSSVP